MPRHRPAARDRNPADCPCGLPASYPQCCGRLHSGRAQAAGPEELMRSRFTAFVRGDAAYLLRSWHPSTRPGTLELGPEPRWLRLEVVRATDGGAFGAQGTVEFRAFYSDHGVPGEMRERSRFVRHRGAWVYLDGEVAG